MSTSVVETLRDTEEVEYDALCISNFAPMETPMYSCEGRCKVRLYPGVYIKKDKSTGIENKQR